MKIEDLFVPEDIALKFKELGISGECLAYYSSGHLCFVKDVLREGGFYNNAVTLINKTRIAAFTFQQVFAYFRENNNLHHDIVHQESSSQEWYDAYVEGEKIDECGTYRQAELACIYALIDAREELKPFK